VVDELSVVNVIFELRAERTVDPFVDSTGLFYMPVPSSESVLHENAENLGDAEVWEVEEMLCRAGSNGIEDILDPRCHFHVLRGPWQVKRSGDIRIKK
jgi:hypothetical protein